jgi:hypothetical protein
MSGNATVRDRVLEAIRTGKVPARSAERTWAGRGCGASCAICGRPINADELEYELEFVTDDHGKQRTDYHVHGGCFWAWESEVRKPELKRSDETSIELSGVVAEARVAEDEREAPGDQGST